MSSLTDYSTLGRSGLVVSPLALGTMTFGTKGWGSADDVSEAIFNAYMDAGGNFFDSADSRKNIYRALDSSLKRLGTDCPATGILADRARFRT